MVSLSNQERPTWVYQQTPKVSTGRLKPSAPQVVETLMFPEMGEEVEAPCDSGE